MKAKRNHYFCNSSNPLPYASRLGQEEEVDLERTVGSIIPNEMDKKVEYVKLK